MPVPQELLSFFMSFGHSLVSNRLVISQQLIQFELLSRLSLNLGSRRAQVGKVELSGDVQREVLRQTLLSLRLQIVFHDILRDLLH